MDRKIIELDVGGKLFRTTKSTLCSIDNYFSRMLLENNWFECNESNSPHEEPNNNISNRIFIDRDPDVFDGILSYLRCGRSFISDQDSINYLERLAVEADFYQLEGLIGDLTLELSKRNALLNNKLQNNEIYKVVIASEVNYNLNNGWIYVNSYEGNETTSCIVSGAKAESLFRSNQCTGCNELMNYEKFCKHVNYFKPTMIVLKKYINTNHNIIDKNISNSSNIIENSILFDQSFG